MAGLDKCVFVEVRYCNRDLLKEAFKHLRCQTLSLDQLSRYRHWLNILNIKSLSGQSLCEIDFYDDEDFLSRTDEKIAVILRGLHNTKKLDYIDLQEKFFEAGLGRYV